MTQSRKNFSHRLRERTSLLLIVWAALFMLPRGCRTSSSLTVDRRNPDSVLRAYFAAWSRNDTATEKSFMTSNYAKTTWYPEPVDSVTVPSIRLLDEKSARLWSSGSPDTARVYLVDFDYRPKGRGFSMERGRYRWTYTLTWDAKH